MRPLSEHDHSELVEQMKAVKRFVEITEDKFAEALFDLQWADSAIARLEGLVDSINERLNKD